MMVDDYTHRYIHRVHIFFNLSNFSLHIPLLYLYTLPHNITAALLNIKTQNIIQVFFWVVPEMFILFYEVVKKVLHLIIAFFHYGTLLNVCNVLRYFIVYMTFKKSKQQPRAIILVITVGCIPNFLYTKD